MKYTESIDMIDTALVHVADQIFPQVYKKNIFVIIKTTKYHNMIK